MMFFPYDDYPGNFYSDDPLNVIINQVFGQISAFTGITKSLAVVNCNGNTKLLCPSSKSLLEAIALNSYSQPGIIFCDNVGAVVDSVELDSFQIESGRSITIHWSSPPRIDHAIRETVTELADVALSLWPDWPVTDGKGDHFKFGRSQQTGRIIDVADRWFTQAWKCCKNSTPPLPQTYGNTVNATRLRDLFSDQPLFIILAVEKAALDDPGLDALCRVLLWLSTNTVARPFLLLPEILRTSAELAKCDLQIMEWSAQSDVSNTPKPERKGSYWPLKNRPHPQSPGEQLLNNALHKDEELRGVFQFNVPVETSYGSRYLVDLLAKRSKAIVEIDGYTHHSSKHAFKVDRHRDYELQTSGYLVLRLPHDEVINDPQGSVSKIKNFIRFRQQYE